MTDLESLFTHGNEYLENSMDVPRTKCCNSCAFTDKVDTVRPKDVSIEDLEKFTAGLDVFYCHSKEDGQHKICAKWFASFKAEELSEA